MRGPRRHCERSEAIRLVNHKAGLLRRVAPRNDGVRYRGMTANAATQPSLRAQRSNPALHDKLDCFVALLLARRGVECESDVYDFGVRAAIASHGEQGAVP